MAQNPFWASIGSFVVAIATEGFGGTAICCGYVPADDGVTPARLRTALTGTLPAYMLPTSWAAFDALPKNANGKIDRRSVRESFEAGAEAAG